MQNIDCLVLRTENGNLFIKIDNDNNDLCFYIPAHSAKILRFAVPEEWDKAYEIWGYRSFSQEKMSAYFLKDVREALDIVTPWENAPTNTCIEFGYRYAFKQANGTFEEVRVVTRELVHEGSEVSYPKDLKPKEYRFTRTVDGVNIQPRRRRKVVR